MSSFSPELLDRLAGTVTSICQCWRVTCRDGSVHGFTDHDAAIAFGGIEYRPETGFSASEAQNALGLSIDSVDVEGVLSGGSFAAEELAAGRLDGAKVETFLVDWSEPAQNAHLRTGYIGRIALADGHFRAELESPATFLDRPRGRYFQRGCDAVLGDARCGFDLQADGYSADATILSHTAPGRVVVDGADGFPDGWFAAGVLRLSEGGEPARRWDIASHRRGTEGAEIDLWPASPLPVQGAVVQLTAGCDKRFSTCKAKFGNSLNFQGFPHLPGNDRAYGYAAEGGLFDGSPLVP